MPRVRRAAAVSVGPHGCQQLVVVVEDAARDSSADPLVDAALATAVRDAVREVVPTPVAAVLCVPAVPVDIRHNTKIDRTLLSRWAGSVLAGGSKKRPW